MKVTIIGAGRVGAALAYTLCERNFINELVLVDINKDIAEGNADDILQACIGISKTYIFSGSYADVKGSDIVVISAGRPRTPDMKSRMDLIHANMKIVDSICAELKPCVSENTIIITICNPMDIMNYYIQQKLGLPRNRVIGSGGVLDSFRFKHLLSKELRVRPNDIEAYVIGEHGDGHVPLFDMIFLKGNRIMIDENKRKELLPKLREFSKEILTKKGCTEFAPANATTRMIESIAFNSGHIMPCSLVLDGEYGQRGISTGVPARLGKDGAEVVKWDLSDWEKAKFNDSCDKIKELIKEIV